MTNWSKVASRIYNHGSAVKSTLDLRLLLHSVKTPNVKDIPQVRTNYKIEVILFDPAIDLNWIQEYTNTCLTATASQTSITQPEIIKLDQPLDMEDEIFSTHGQVFTFYLRFF